MIKAVNNLSYLNTKYFFTREEFAAYIGVSLAHTFKLTMNRAVPCYKKGKRTYFKRSEINKWITECKIPMTNLNEHTESFDSPGTIEIE